MKKQRITLEITYDPRESDPPSLWTWHILCDLPDRDHVTVVAAEEVT